MKIDYHDGDAGPTAGALAVIGGSVAEQKKPPTAEATRFLSHAVAAALKYRYTVLLPAGLALFTTTPIYSHLRATAAPPPGPLLPRNAKLEFTLLRYLTPILLLFLALLIPARTRTQRWLVSGVFAPAIFYLHWANLSYGCMNRVFGFVLGIHSVFHSYQTLDLLLLSCPRTTFSRVPILIQRHHALTRQPNIPPKYLDPYPTSLRRRIPWVFELIATMRFLGWHTPHSQPTTSAHLLRSCPPPTLTRSRFIKTCLLRVLAMSLIIDFNVWNIRVNDVGFHLPYLLLPAQQAATSTPTPPQIEFTVSFPAVPIYPSPPRLHLSSSPPWLRISLEQNPSYRLLPQQIPFPKYTLLPIPSPSSSSHIYKSYIFPLYLSLTRTSLLVLALYVGLLNLFYLATLVIMLLGYIFYLPSSSSSSDILAENNWFSLTAYPHPFSFTEISFQRPPGVGRFWARTWHGLFRRVFLRPWVVGRVPRIVAVVGAFILSGILHLAGVRTAVDNIPSGGWGCFFFFALQPLGMLIELATRGIWTRFIATLLPAKGSCGMEKTRRIVEVAAGWVWVLGWFAVTSRWFFDDLAWVGLWGVEAAPVSLWQEGWWRWGRQRGAANGMGGGGASGEWGWWEWNEGGKGWGVVI